MNNTEINFPKGSKSDLRDVITNQLLIFLEAQNYDAAKTLLMTYLKPYKSLLSDF